MDKKTRMKHKLNYFNIFGLKIEVSTANLENKELAGYYDPVKNEIVISDEYEGKFHTLIHELGHVVWNRLGINQTQVPLDIQEIVVEGFATAFIENFEQIKRANKILEKK